MTKQQKTILLLLMIITPCLWAQKKELSQARSYIKSGKDFDKAEQLMVGLLKDSANRDNKKIYVTWLEAVRGQYAAGNEKLYLKQNYDTTAFFNLTKRMFYIAEMLDSLDMQPDSKGRVKPDYREDNARLLDPLRLNLYSGGTYQVRKSDFKQAYAFFADYLDTDIQPLFTGYQYAEKDSRMVQAAYWATYCGYKLHDAERTLKYHQMALRLHDKEASTLQYISEAYSLQQDQESYLGTLREGFHKYPENPYFFPRLADYYKDQGSNDSLLYIADEGLQANAKNTLFLLAKSIALLNMNRYGECVLVSREMIAQNDTLPEPYYNIATCNLNQALSLEQLNEPRKYRQQLRTLYADARPFMEKYRKLAPEDKDRWGPALYRIYLHLNMGKQFEEIDNLLRNH